MLLRIVRPMRRDGSSKIYFRQRIPLDVLEQARGKTISLPLGENTITKTISPKATEVKVSTQTSDQSEGKTRQAVMAAHLEAYWKTLRNGPTVLTHKQIVALSGELYAAWVDTLEDDPVTPEFWERMIVENEAAIEGKAGRAPLVIGKKNKFRLSLEARFGKLTDFVLAKRSLIIDEESRSKLLVHTAKAMTYVSQTLKKYAEGDYTTDQTVKRFPKWVDAQPQAKAKPKEDMMQLVDDWWKEAERANRSPSTYEEYRRSFKKLCDFLKHKDALKVTIEDMVAFKDFRLSRVNERTGKPISPKTVKENELAGIKSVFNWAVGNHRMKENPAKDIVITQAKKIKVRPKYFTEAERKAILFHARDYQRTGREAETLALAKKWVPWICAYTGARIGEILQLRKKDIKLEEGYWVLYITPEAGDVKTKEYRVVPIHEHLVEMGLLELAQQSRTEYLFINASAEAEVRNRVKANRNKVGSFIREVYSDPNLQPNHGWRHTFKTFAREIEFVQEKVLDDITGHSAKTEGDKYGESTVKARVMLMEKFPRLIPDS